MNKTLIAVIAGIVALGLFIFVNFSSAVTTGVNHQENIKQTFEQGKTLRATYSTKIVEMIQVPAMAKDDLRDLIRGAMEGRYGDNGVQSTVALILERYPGSMDPALYRNVQTEMNAGREKISNNEQLLLEHKTLYQKQLQYLWSGFWLKFAGYPTADFSFDNYPNINNTATMEIYEKGLDDPIIFYAGDK